jgi:hypothetical protein
MQNSAAGPARRRTGKLRAIVSGLIALIGHVQASLQLIETAMARERRSATTTRPPASSCLMT